MRWRQMLIEQYGGHWLRERGQRAGRASAKARLRRIALRANAYKSKSKAFVAGYERGYSAAYKRHWEYWKKRAAWEAAKR